MKTLLIILIILILFILCHGIKITIRIDDEPEKRTKNGISK